MNDTRHLAGATSETDFHPIERHLTSNRGMLDRLREQFPKQYFRIDKGDIYVLSTQSQYDAIWAWFWNNQ